MMKPFYFVILMAVGAPALTAATAPGAPNAQKTRELLATIESSDDIAVRAHALQQLSLVATAEAAPRMATLLSDEKLGQYARDVLEGISDPAAGEVLRAAIPRLQGRALVGAINSLGVRRDERAVDLLAKLVREANVSAAPAALIALGQIGNAAAVQELRKTLLEGPAELRAAAAEGCLLAAERPGNRNSRVATELYSAVSARADLPLALRVAATRGTIMVGSESEVSALLIANLHSPEAEFRDMALLCIREVRVTGIARALVEEMPKLSALLQARLMAALVDRDEQGILGAIEHYAATGSGEVRLAALKALGRIGAGSSLPILLRAAAAAETAPTALRSLVAISSKEAEARIIEALGNSDSAARVRLIGVLGERKAIAATPQLITFAQGKDAVVRDAALRALGLVATPAGLPLLIELALAAPDEATKTLADRAIVTTSMKVLEPGRRAEPVLKAFREATRPDVQSALLRPLGAIVRSMGGSHEALFAIRNVLNGASPPVRAAALRTLADWPTSAAATTLIALAKSSETKPNEREIALRGALRMATAVAAGRERSPLNALEIFTEAGRAAQTLDEKRLVVASLGSLKHPAAVALLQPFLDDPALQGDASLALVQIAAGMEGAKDPALISLLQRVAAIEKDEDTRRKAARLAKGLPLGGGKANAKAPNPRKAIADGPPAFFNGVDLGDWDGDPGVWRVRDGAIVGGSLEGNPRNEFLATRRSYGNFVLRLEYKLVGTEGFINGGVQFRSVRIEKPANEMSGYQADIGNGHTGSLYDESRRKKFLMRADADRIKRLERPGEWNRLEIRCDGPRIELSVNGEKTLNYVEAEPGIAMEGLIALQIHGKCKAEISFRNFAIEELPATGSRLKTIP